MILERSAVLYLRIDYISPSLIRFSWRAEAGGQEYAVERAAALTRWEEGAAGELAFFNGLRELAGAIEAAEIGAKLVDDLAGRLGISRSTLESHRRRIAAKCGLRGAAELSAFAIRFA